MADVPFLLSLRRETMDRPLAASGVAVDEASHRAWVMHPFDCAEILLADGEPVGLLKLRRSAAEWEIVQVQLVPSLHGRGIGRTLLQDVLAEAAAADVRVCLSVLKAHPARHLYERLGFGVVDEDTHEFHMRVDA